MRCLRHRVAKKKEEAKETRGGVLPGCGRLLGAEQLVGESSNTTHEKAGGQAADYAVEASLGPSAANGKAREPSEHTTDSPRVTRSTSLQLLQGNAGVTAIIFMAAREIIISYFA